MIYVICIYSCTTLWQVQSCLRAAARESKPGEIIDSKTMEKKAKEMKRGRGIGRGRGRGRGRGKGKGRGKGRGRKQPCQQNEEEDSDENPELKILEEEDMEIRRSLGMEEDFEKEDKVSGSMLWLHVFRGSILSHHVPLTRSAIPTSCKLRHPSDNIFCCWHALVILRGQWASAKGGSSDRRGKVIEVFAWD